MTESLIEMESLEKYCSELKEKVMKEKKADDLELRICLFYENWKDGCDIGIAFEIMNDKTLSRDGMIQLLKAFDYELEE